ncbi:cycloeucalenol cycloisomerase [Dorcoceras hygrometricum]|uniref:Cycloeucalenol cycloisomerase n=1 Tax=Dorcoceras hygrometricum TaxID=472368 RepID=A0A2Z6ZZ37_9LAMI|nr:cycloeucalenol cycloisomerase [Dorcoceras hygrometricum]
MSLFDLQDVCMAIGSIATLDLPMVVDLIGIYGLKGPYCTLTTTNWFLQALSEIPRGSWGDVARRFTMIRWASAEVGVRPSSNLWLAQDPSKRWGEVFFLLYTPHLCLGIVVPYKLYENFTEWEYLFLGLVSALPAFIIPMILVGKFPYYEFVDRASMYKVGSLFYAIYFFVSFPMFLRIDEKPGDPWDLPRVAIDALGAAMLVTIILDLWRIFLGPIVPVPDSKQCSQPGLPWFPVNT